MNAEQERFVERVATLLEGAGVVFDTVQSRTVGTGLGTLIRNYTAAVTEAVAGPRCPVCQDPLPVPACGHSCCTAPGDPR